MGNPVQPGPPLPQGYQVGTTVVSELPAQRAFPLTNADFLTLCDGSSSNERGGRDLCVGIWVGAVTGLISLICSVEIPEALSRRAVFWSFVVLLIMAAASFAGVVIFVTRMMKENTPYTRLKKTIVSFFPTL
jgi:hypothetical protein